MEGAEGDLAEGVIPRTIRKIYDEARNLEEKVVVLKVDLHLRWWFILLDIWQHRHKELQLGSTHSYFDNLVSQAKITILAPWSWLPPLYSN